MGGSFGLFCVRRVAAAVMRMVVLIVVANTFAHLIQARFDPRVR